MHAHTGGRKCDHSFCRLFMSMLSSVAWNDTRLSAESSEVPLLRLLPLLPDAGSVHSMMIDVFEQPQRKEQILCRAVKNEG